MTQLHLSGLVFIVGAYGSGKSEIAVQLAVLHEKQGMAVNLVDMDLVNPYFRTREAREALTKIGVNVVLPDNEYVNADLPVISPKVQGVLRSPGELTLVDVGGDPVGAMPLASFKEALAGQTAQVFQVVNPYRPFTSTIEVVLKMRSAIEASSGLVVTGLIANPNLLDDTTVETITDGAEKMSDITDALELPCKCIAISDQFKNEFNDNSFCCPILFLERQLVPPWLRPGTL